MYAAMLLGLVAAAADPPASTELRNDSVYSRINVGMKREEVFGLFGRQPDGFSIDWCMTGRLEEIWELEHGVIVIVEYRGRYVGLFGPVSGKRMLRRGLLVDEKGE